MGWGKRLLYGVLIGIASIAPGLSGGTIAIALGFYENLISAVADLLKSFQKSFSYLLPYGTGAIFSIAALSVVFDYLFTEFPLPTNALFIGFILSTLPFIKGRFAQSLGNDQRSCKHILAGILFFILVIIPVLAKSSAVSADDGWDSSINAGSMLMFFAIGVIVAATLVIPGLSGTMILTALGFYRPMLTTASTFVTAAVSLDINTAAQQLYYIVPMGIGIAIGGFIIAKMLNILFRKIPSYIYAAVTGLLCATPIVMLSGVSKSELELFNIAAAIAALIIGVLLGHKLGDKEN